MTHWHLLRRLAQLRGEFGLGLRPRVEDLSRRVAKLAADPAGDGLRDLLTSLESLRDAARTFGHTKLAAIAEHVAEELPGHFPPVGTESLDASQHAALRKLLDSLGLATSRALAEAPSAVDGKQPGIVVIGEENERRAELLVELTLGGYRGVARDGVVDLEPRDALHEAHAVIVDAEQLGDGLAGLEQVRESCSAPGAPAATPRTPIVVVSARGDTDARLEAMRAGVDGYFTRPLDFGDLRARLGELGRQNALPTHRVIVVDDDADRTRRAAAALVNARIATQVVTTTRELQRALKAEPPDMILLDVGMRSVDARALAARLRTVPSLEDLPVVLFSAAAGADDAGASAGDGGTEVAARSEQLLTLVGSHIDRAGHARRRSPAARRRGEIAKLSNQDYFLSAVESAVGTAGKRSQTFGVLHIGLDGTDELLARATAEQRETFTSATEERLLLCLRKADVAARFTSDSFVVLLKNVGGDEARLAAERIQEDFSDQVFECGDLSFPVTCTVGVSRIDGDTESTEEVLAQARSAYSLAATSPSSKVHLHDSVADALAREQHEARLVDLLKRGLRSDGLRLQFQPVLQLKTQETGAFEVSLSLSDGQGREVPDPQIAALAERVGLQAEVDRWLLENAVDFVAGWPGERGVRLMLTLSRDTLRDRGFPAWLSERIETAQIPATSLVVGFGADVVSAHLNDAREVFKTLSAAGFPTQLTHFGRTPNPMLVLKHVSVNFVSVDGSVIERIGVDRQAEIALRGMVESAHARGMSITASAVESPGKLPALWACGVDYIQGGFVGPRSTSLADASAEGIQLLDAGTAA